MKLKQIAEAEKEWKFSKPENNFDILDPEWENKPGLGDDVKSLRKKMLSLDHQAEIMLSKLSKWVKLAKGKVFTATGLKTGMPLPKEVQSDPRKYLNWTLVHTNPNVVTKVYCQKDNPKIVLPVRALIYRHNELTDSRAKAEGDLAKLNRRESSDKELQSLVAQNKSSIKTG